MIQLLFKTHIRTLRRIANTDSNKVKKISRSGPLSKPSQIEKPSPALFMKKSQKMKKPIGTSLIEPWGREQEKV